MSGLEFSSFVHLGWKKGKRAEARFLFLAIRWNGLSLIERINISKIRNTKPLVLKPDCYHTSIRDLQKFPC